MHPSEPNSANRSYKAMLHEVIFEADTRAGKIFDVLLLLSIILSVCVVMLESVTSIRQSHGDLLYALEWFFTILFTIEYLLRLYCIVKPLKYALSFFGLVDLLSILPTYLALIFPGTHYLLIIRVLRMLRVFRVLKLVQYVGESRQLVYALRAAQRKITIFVFAVITMVFVLGSLMYVIEGEENGFSSIPLSVYWAIVTLTTVGYGDISPQTPIGQALASMVMIMGYGVIAVPTGIVTVELSSAVRKVSTQACLSCAKEGHDPDASFCKYCGSHL